MHSSDKLLFYKIMRGWGPMPSRKDGPTSHIVQSEN